MTTLEVAIGLRIEKKHDHALKVLHDLLEASPADPILHYQYAWTCDNAGKEGEAALHYEAAISKGLLGDDRRSAFLGLGRTYRCLGQYEKSLSVFNSALLESPNNRALKVFRALTLYNLGKHSDSVGILLSQLAETTADQSIKDYAQALLFYSDKLDKTQTGVEEFP